MSEENMKFSAEEFGSDDTKRIKAIFGHLDREMKTAIENAYRSKCIEEAEACLKRFYAQYEKDERNPKHGIPIKEIISLYAEKVTYNGEEVFPDDVKKQIQENWDSWIAESKKPESKEPEKTGRISQVRPAVKNRDEKRKNHKYPSSRSIAIALIGGFLIGLIFGWTIGHAGRKKAGNEPADGSAIVIEQGSAVDTDGGSAENYDNDNVIDIDEMNPEQGTSSGVVSVGGLNKDIAAVLLQTVNLREEASSESEWIMRLEKDQEITILGEEYDGWTQISVRNQEGTVVTGFIKTMLNDKAVYQVNDSND